MRIVTKITAGLLLLTAVGCREMPTVTVGGGRTLAKAGGATLDEQELDRALPAGLTATTASPSPSCMSANGSASS